MMYVKGTAVKTGVYVFTVLSSFQVPSSHPEKVYELLSSSARVGIFFVVGSASPFLYDWLSNMEPSQLTVQVNGTVVKTGVYVFTVPVESQIPSSQPEKVYELLSSSARVGISVIVGSVSPFL